MRAFVAIDLPPWEEPMPPGLRAEDHLTLHFFEELPADRIPSVVESMIAAAEGSVPFEMEVRGVGAFPSPARPRVVWAGVGEGSASLSALAGRLRDALTARGFPTESRPFVPHRTLYRVRSPRSAAWAHQFLGEPKNANRVWGRTTVRELVLKESELLPTGARHTVRERVPLAGSSRL